jgi:hypothetical protein
VFIGDEDRKRKAKPKATRVVVQEYFGVGSVARCFWGLCCCGSVPSKLTKNSHALIDYSCTQPFPALRIARLD